MSKVLLIGGALIVAAAAAARLAFDPGLRPQALERPAIVKERGVVAVLDDAPDMPASESGVSASGGHASASTAAGTSSGFEGIKRFERSIVDESDQIVNGRRAGKTHQFEDDPAYVFEQRSRKYDPVVNGLTAERRGRNASQATSRIASSSGTGGARAAGAAPVTAAGLEDPQDIPRRLDPDIARLLAQGSGGTLVHTDFARQSAQVYTAMIRWGDVRPTLVVESGDPSRAAIRVAGARLVAPVPPTLLQAFYAEPTADGVRFVYRGRGRLELSIREGRRSAIVTLVDHGA